MISSFKPKGWQIVCIRMPISQPLYAIEESFFPSSKFERWCSENHLMYLDYSKSPFPTCDGSHLDADEAMAFTTQLALDLRSKAGW